MVELMICQNCGAVLRQAVRSCRSCGGKLSRHSPTKMQVFVPNSGLQNTPQTLQQHNDPLLVERVVTRCKFNAEMTPKPKVFHGSRSFLESERAKQAPAADVVPADGASGNGPLADGPPGNAAANATTGDASAANPSSPLAIQSAPANGPAGTTLADFIGSPPFTPADGAEASSPQTETLSSGATEQQSATTGDEAAKSSAAQAESPDNGSKTAAEPSQQSGVDRDRQNANSDRISEASAGEVTRSALPGYMAIENTLLVLQDGANYSFTMSEWSAHVEPKEHRSGTIHASDEEYAYWLHRTPEAPITLSEGEYPSL